MAFNKTSTGIRVGNWVEEEALKTLTGTHRVTKVGDKMLDTTARVIAHSDRVEASDYKSTAHASQTAEKAARVHEDRRMGVRERRLEASLRAEATELLTRAEPAPPSHFETLAQGTFVRHDDAEYTAEKGRRVMKTTDGVPIPPGTRDLDMLANAGVASRAPRLSPSAAATLSATAGAGAGAVPDFPISYYTQAAARGVPGMTAAVGANPFFKSSKFTKPAGEHSDMIDEPPAWATEEVGSAAVHAGGELTMHEVLERLRVAIRARGGDNGIKTLTRVLRRMDATGDGLLSLEELGDGLRDMGIEASRRDVSALMLYFDTDRSGKISVDELQKGLAPPMPERRLALVREAFRRLDKTGDGVVKIDDLALAYDTSKHPLVKAGDMTPEQALTEFLGSFEGAERDGVVTEAEFHEYYRGVSANIPLDDYFELMMRNAWHISGGSGWSENTSCKRVLVKFPDHDEVVELTDDLGLNATDIPAIKAKLRKQGVTGFVDVKLYE